MDMDIYIYNFIYFSMIFGRALNKKETQYVNSKHVGLSWVPFPLTVGSEGFVGGIFEPKTRTILVLTIASTRKGDNPIYEPFQLMIHEEKEGKTPGRLPALVVP